MWEFSINIKNNNNQIINYVKTMSGQFLKNINGFSTVFSDELHTYIIFAVEECHKDKMQGFLTRIITKIISSYFKNDFLTSRLALNSKKDINVFAFKKALMNFDKETDAFIISKNLTFDKNLYLESFYDFRLGKLRDKWEELVSLANENKDYLLNSDTLLDLLKFLIDNIDISQQEIDVVEEEGGYRIFAESDDESMEGLSEERLVSSLIDMSPQKINLYCKKENPATELLQKIFEKRVNFRFARKNDCLKFEKI